MRDLLYAFQAMMLGSMALLAGAQIYVAVGVTPAMKVLPAEVSVRVHQELLTWRPGRVFKPATTVALAAALAGLVVLPFAPEDHPLATALLTALALCVMAFYADITLRTEFPINRQVRSWEQGTVPEGYAELRAHWDARQRVKTYCVGLAFVSTVAAVMVSG